VLSAFSAGLLLIEFRARDKTFYRRNFSYAALTTADIYRCGSGYNDGTFCATWTSGSAAQGLYYAEITFVGFGLKLLYEASRMPAQSCDAEVVKEATAAVDKTELKSTQQVQMAICLEAFVLTFWQSGVIALKLLPLL